MKPKQFAVLGIGRFGESLIKELVRMGYDVLAVDLDEELIRDAVEYSTHAVQADSMDEQVLKALGIANFDAVIVAIGENMQSNILTTILLKELGVKKVVAKAKNLMHGKVLEKIGADLVIYPERDMAIKLARSLASQNFMEQITLSTDYSIIEITTPKSFINQNLRQIGLRPKMNVTILAIRRGEEIFVVPGPDQQIVSGDILVALGHNRDLDALSDVD
ncbi:MAG: TrkA family potassium uptake protein [Syntrophomonas sp.]|nr:TrkA family potassium uptake protein [Syntrophomonas sp.]